MTEKRVPWIAQDWRLWLGIIFSCIFLILVLQDVQLSGIIVALQQVNPLWLLLAVASFIATSLAKAIRWRLLFVKSLPLERLFSILCIGLFLNAFAPARLGELARAYMIGESEAESKVYSLGTIAIEKAADLVFLVISLALLLSQMDLPDWLATPARATALSISFLLPVVLFLVWHNHWLQSMLERAGHSARHPFMHWALGQISVSIASLRRVRQPRTLVSLAIWSLLIWILGASTNYLAFAAMGLNLSVWAALLLLAVLQVGIAVPSSPGRIGVFHYLVAATLAVFGVSKDIALGYSVVLYLSVYGPIAVLGVFYLWQEKVTWRKLDQAIRGIAHFARRWGPVEHEG